MTKSGNQKSCIVTMDFLASTLRMLILGCNAYGHLALLDDRYGSVRLTPQQFAGAHDVNATSMVSSVRNLGFSGQGLLLISPFSSCAAKARFHW